MLFRSEVKTKKILKNTRGANLYDLSLKIKDESHKHSTGLRWCLNSISNIISPNILIFKIKRKFYL